MYEIIFDESFGFDKTHEYILSIQVSLDGFSFSAVHDTENKLVAFKHTPLKISDEKFLARRFREWIESEKLFQQTFKKINVIVNTPFFTFIPNSFFTEKNKSGILNNLFEINFDFETGVNVLENYHANLLFAIPKEIKELLPDSQQEISFWHPLKIISSKLPEIKFKNSLVLFFKSKEFYALFFNEKKLLMGNSYKVSHPNDTIFYVLTAIKQFAVSTKNTPLLLAGNPEIMHLSGNELKKYFPEIEPLKLNSEIEISPGLTDDNKSVLLTLLL